VGVVVKYRNPRHPGEAGLVIISAQSQIAEVRADLRRQGLIIVDDDGADLPAPSWGGSTT
jgi:hypothetical protein